VGSQIRDGFVYVNLDSNGDDKAPINTKGRAMLDNMNLQVLHCTAEWKFDADFSWKLAGMPKPVH
jgi:hypothetical protein